MTVKLLSPAHSGKGSEKHSSGYIPSFCCLFIHIVVCHIFIHSFIYLCSPLTIHSFRGQLSSTGRMQGCLVQAIAFQRSHSYIHGRLLSIHTHFSSSLILRKHLSAQWETQPHKYAVTVSFQSPDGAVYAITERTGQYIRLVGTGAWQCKCYQTGDF